MMELMEIRVDGKQDFCLFLRNSNIMIHVKNLLVLLLLIGMIQPIALNVVGDLDTEVLLLVLF